MADLPLNAVSGTPARARALIATSLAWYGLLALVIAAPLPLGSNRPQAWTAATAIAALALLCALPLWRTAPRAALRALWVPLAAAAASLIWAFLQTQSWMPATWHHPVWARAAELLAAPPRSMIGVDGEAALAALVKPVGYVCVFLTAFALGGERERAALLLRAVLWSAAAYAVYGLIVYFSGNRTVLWYAKWAYFDDVTGPFVNRNNFATYLGFALVACFALGADGLRRAVGHGRSRKERIRRLIEQAFGGSWHYIAAAVVLFTTLLLTHSRGGIGASLFGLLAVSGLLALRGAASRTPLLVILAAAALLALTALSGDGFLDRTLTFSLDGEERDNVFSLAQAAIADRPWLGHGYGSFESAFAAYRDATVQHTWDKAHNVYLELAFELGIPAAALWSLAIAWLAGICLVGYLRRQRDRTYPLVALGCAAIAASHSLVDFSLQIPAVAIVFAAVLGVGVRQSFSSRTA